MSCKLGGWIKQRYTYEVKIGTVVYHRGYARRAAVHAYKRAQKGSKGFPAPCEGKRLVFMRDGVAEFGLYEDGQAFRI